MRQPANPAVTRPDAAFRPMPAQSGLPQTARPARYAALNRRHRRRWPPKYRPPPLAHGRPGKASPCPDATCPLRTRQTRANYSEVPPWIRYASSIDYRPAVRRRQLRLRTGARLRHHLHAGAQPQEQLAELQAFQLLDATLATAGKLPQGVDIGVLAHGNRENRHLVALLASPRLLGAQLPAVSRFAVGHQEQPRPCVRHARLAEALLFLLDLGQRQFHRRTGRCSAIC